MLPLLVATTIQFDFAPVPIEESVARYCAAQVGIPYGSDNFTDAEWFKFQTCVLNKQ